MDETALNDREHECKLLIQLTEIQLTERDPDFQKLEHEQNLRDDDDVELSNTENSEDSYMQCGKNVKEDIGLLEEAKKETAANKEEVNRTRELGRTAWRSEEKKREDCNNKCKGLVCVVGCFLWTLFPFLCFVITTQEILSMDEEGKALYFPLMMFLFVLMFIFSVFYIFCEWTNFSLPCLICLFLSVVLFVTVDIDGKIRCEKD